MQNFFVYSEIALRVVRAFAYFYMLATPLLDFDDTKLVIGTILLCLGLVGITNLLIKKVRNKLGELARQA